MTRQDAVGHVSFSSGCVNKKFQSVSSFDPGQLFEPWTYGSYPLHILNNVDVESMSVTALEHVLVLAEDIERTREFYGLVGLRAGERPPLEFPGYWLYADGGSAACLHIADRAAYRAHAARLGLNVSDGRPGPGGIDHIAFNATGYQPLCDRLARAGVAAVHNAVPAAGMVQLFIEDPNGVRVEINVHQEAR